jgi:hypothetical protein
MMKSRPLLARAKKRKTKEMRTHRPRTARARKRGQICTTIKICNLRPQVMRKRTRGTSVM